MRPIQLTFLFFIASLSIIYCQPKAKPCRILEVLNPNLDSLYPVFIKERGFDEMNAFLDSLADAQRSEEPDSNAGYFILRDSIDILCRLHLSQYWENPPIICGLRNDLNLILNREGKFLIEGESGSLPILDSIWKVYQTNDGKDPNYSISSKRAMAEVTVFSTVPIDSLWAILSVLQTARNAIILEKLAAIHMLPFCEISDSLVQQETENYPLNIIINRYNEEDKLPLPIVSDSIFDQVELIHEPNMPLSRGALLPCINLTCCLGCV